VKAALGGLSGFEEMDVLGAAAGGAAGTARRGKASASGAVLKAADAIDYADDEWGEEDEAALMGDMSDECGEGLAGVRAEVRVGSEG